MEKRSSKYGSVEISHDDKTRLNRVRGEEDFKSYSEVIKFLLDKHFRG